MITKRISGPDDEPVSIAEIREHLRYPDVTPNNAELLEFIKAAREHVENKLERAILTQTWELIADRFPPNADWHGGYCPGSEYIQLPYPPLQSVTSIIYYDADNATQTLATSEYVVDTVGGIIRLAPDKSWPSVYSRYDAVTVRYVSGWATAEAVPTVIKAYIKLYVEAMDSNRGLISDRDMPLTPFAERLLDRYRQLGV